MNLKHVFIYFVMAIIFISCGGHKDCNHDHGNGETEVTAQQWLITSNSAGFVKLGQQKDDIQLEDEMTMSSELVDVGEGMQDTQWFIKKNNTTLLGFFVSQQRKGGGVIWEIQVMSSDFKTEESIGVGSSIKEFKTAYSDLNLWFTPYGYHFVAETSAMPDVQFFIDPKAYTGGDDKLMQPGETISLTESDFNMNGKLVMVRMFTPYF